MFAHIDLMHLMPTPKIFSVGFDIFWLLCRFAYIIKSMIFTCWNLTVKVNTILQCTKCIHTCVLLILSHFSLPEAYLTYASSIALQVYCSSYLLKYLFVHIAKAATGWESRSGHFLAPLCLMDSKVKLLCTISPSKDTPCFSHTYIPPSFGTFVLASKYSGERGLAPRDCNVFYICLFSAKEYNLCLQANFHEIVGKLFSFILRPSLHISLLVASVTLEGG